MTIEELQQTLLIDAKKTSAYRRKKESAEDNRIEARAVGAVGIAVIVSMTFVIVFFDLTTLCMNPERMTHFQ